MKMMLMKRRDFLKAGAAAGAMASLYGCAGGNKAGGHVVVVGGGYGGATVAKYLRMWSQGSVQVTLIERNPTFISCPISNLVIAGMKSMEDITVSYDNLKSKWGVRVLQDDVLSVDTAKRSVKLLDSKVGSFLRRLAQHNFQFPNLRKIPTHAFGRRCLEAIGYAKKSARIEGQLVENCLCLEKRTSRKWI
jgi:sulfite dehydrogenase